jgi:hypothetical protein
MPLLINDANIFIDLAVSGMTAQIFALPYQFAVPDVLFEQELRAQHADLLNRVYFENWIFVVGRESFPAV